MNRLRPWLVAALVGAAFCTSAAALAGDAPAPGRTVLAPGDFKLEDYAGKVLVVDFWASWCKPCGKSLPWLSGLAATHVEDGLAVVAVNLDEDLAAAKPMMKELCGDVIVVHDPEGELAGRYKLEGMPSAYVYDRSGKLRASHIGFLPAEADAKKQQILELLGEGGGKDAH